MGSRIRGCRVLKIYVAGHRGLAGASIVEAISKQNDLNWVGASRSELDLFNRQAVREFMAREQPDAVVLAAAKVGGIIANNSQPVDFLYENLQIQQNVLSSALDHRIPKLVFLGSTCIYPRDAQQPMKEDQLWNGPLEATNSAYAVAKLAGVEFVKSVRRQYGLDWVTVLPTNLYGPGDNFNSTSSHVIPGLMRRMSDAMVDNRREFVLWGTGTPKRDFLYSKDLGEAVVHVLQNYSSEEPINIGSGHEVTILELANHVARVMNYDTEIITDPSKPDGTPRKALDVSKMFNLGWQPSTSLESGLASTYAWFMENLDRARL